MKKYYSQKILNVIDTDGKREEMILPDKLALPSLITDVEPLRKLRWRKFTMTICAKNIRHNSEKNPLLLGKASVKKII